MECSLVSCQVFACNASSGHLTSNIAPDYILCSAMDEQKMHCVQTSTEEPILWFGVGLTVCDVSIKL